MKTGENMPTRFIYILQHMDENGEWVTEIFKHFPSIEMDNLDAAGKIWKMTIEKNKKTS